MANRFLSNIKINDAYTFPASDGTNGQVITTDGAGNLTFQDASASGATLIYKDTFTGDSTTVEFTMAQITDNEVKTQVYFDGVYQSKDNYSINGAVITFSTAPPSGAAIEVITFATLTAGEDLNQKLSFYGKASGAISKGDVVMFAGAQGDHFLIAKATQAALAANHEYFLGLAAQDLSNNEYGYVTEFGRLEDMDTSDYTSGDILWFDSEGSTAGAVTTTEPSAPNTKIQIAAVVRVHQNHGVIFVRPTVYHTLSEQQDVLVTSVADKDLLAWNTSTGVWENTKTLGDITTGNITTSGTVDGVDVSSFKSDYDTHNHDSRYYTETEVDTFLTNKTNWDTAYGWGDHSLAGYLTSYTETDPIYTASSWYTTTNNSGNWDTAYGWGNHASVGYLTSFTETDPVFSASASAGITSTQITNWDTAYGWGDHSTQSYATQTYVGDAIAALIDSAPATLDTLNELAAALGDDPNFATTVSTSIGLKWTQDNTKISNWDTAYGWGNHASAGYLTSFTETDPIYTASSWYTTTNNSTNWNTAYGWGNHAGLYSLLGHTHDLIRHSLAAPALIDTMTSTSFRTSLFGSNTNGYAISTSRWNTTPPALSGMNSYGTLFAWSGADTHGFIATDYSTANIQVGGGYGDNVTWKATLVHSGNIGSQSVNYATSAGSATDSSKLPLGGGTLTGQLIVGSASAATSPTLRVNTPTSSTFVHAQENIAANLTSGQHIINVVGKETNTKNSGYIGYCWAGNASDSNFVTIGHWGSDDLLRVYGNGNVTVSGNIASTIFYDSNNTAFYNNPAATSVINAINMGYLGSQVYNTAGQGTLFFNANGEVDIQGYSIGTTLENYGGNYTKLTIDWHTGIKIGAAYNYGGIRFYNNSIKHYSGTQVFSVAEGDSNVRVSNILYVNGDTRSPIFYDSNNTGYYIDPHATSNLNVVQAESIRNNGSVASDDGFGIYWNNDAETSYAIYREPGGWAHPFPDLRIAFHTGIKLGAAASYNGIRFYTDYDMATQVMSVNNSSDGYGAGHVHVNGIMHAGDSHRAPVFYDSNDTGYYVDPTGTSRLNRLYINQRNDNYNVGSHAGTNPVNDWQSLTSNEGQWTVAQYNAIGSYANTPANVYTYGGVMSWRTTNHSFQLYASHTGDLAYKTQWNNDNYSGWKSPVVYGFNGGSSSGKSIYGDGLYDSNDTNYFLNPAETSEVNTIIAKSCGSSYYGGDYAQMSPYGLSTCNVYGESSVSYPGTVGVYNNEEYNNSKPGGTCVNRYMFGNFSCTKLGASATGSLNVALDLYDTSTGEELHFTTETGHLYIGGVIFQNQYSDCRYKTNITTIESALDKIDAIRGVEFDWNELGKEEAHKEGHEVGVIAQEVQSVYPIAVREVTKEKNDKVVTGLVVDYDKLIPLLVQSVKELKARIEILENGNN